MNRTITLLIVFINIFCLQAFSNPTITGELKKWHNITLTYSGPNLCESSAPNPFTDYRLQVTFTGPSGSSYNVPGYFAADGNASESSATCGDKWRVHFIPDQAGTWNYQTSFRTGSNVSIELSPNAGSPYGSLNGQSGTFTVTSTDKSGKDFRAHGMLKYVGQHYLQFQETGKYYLKGGADSPENFLAYHEFDQTSNLSGGANTPGLTNGLHQYGPHVQDWNSSDPTWKNGKGKGIIGALNYLSSKGGNSVYFLTYNIDGGDGRDTWVWTNPNERYRFDVSKLDQWEIVFRHMDHLGIQLHVITQETENNHSLGGLSLQRKLYYRELVARFAHHLALQWNIGEENTNSDADKAAFAEYIRSLDPYNHPITAHTQFDAAESFYDGIIYNQGRIQYFESTSLQGQGGLYNQWANNLRNETASQGKKWVIYGDEQAPAVDPNLSNINQLRQALYGNLMGGGAGVEWYFGYQNTFGDVQSENWRQVDDLWDQTKYAIDFFQNNLPFHEMQPNNNIINQSGNYCLAKPNEVYAMYLPYGGSTNLNLPSGTYAVKWFDPVNGGSLQSGTVASINGGNSVDIGLPPYQSNRSWVALVSALTTPGISITYPANGDLFVAPADVIIQTSLTALNQASEVRFYNGTTLIGTDNAAPYEYLWQGVQPGNYDLIVKAYNGNSFLANSNSVNITVNSSFNVTITQPQDGAVFSALANVTIEAEIDPDRISIDKVAFFENGNFLGEDYAFPYNHTRYGLTPGSYSIVAKGYLGNMEVSSQTITFSVQSQNSTGTFTLINSATDTDIGPLYDGAIINLSDVGPDLNVRVDFNGYNPGSVVYGLNGNSSFQIESISPFTLVGDNNGDYNDWNPTAGTYNLSATTFSDPGGAGVQGPALAITFEVVEDSRVDCNGDPSGWAYVNDCGICVGGLTGLPDDEGKDCTGVCGGSAVLDDCGVCDGDNSTCNCTLGITTIMMVNEGTVGDIRLMQNGVIIDLNLFGGFSFRADPCSPAVESVVFEINGNAFSTENIAPFALAGDNNGSYNAWNPSPGAYELTATPYSIDGAGGTQGQSLTVNFTVINGGGQTTDCNGVVNGNAYINDCGVCVGGTTGLPNDEGKDCAGVCGGNAVLDNCGVCNGNNDCGCTFAISSFTLVREGLGGDIDELENGYVINANAIGNFSIRANACNPVTSVEFILNGNTHSVENIMPYALEGDDPQGSYHAWPAQTGNYTLTAIPYSDAGASGAQGQSLTVNFEVVGTSAKTSPSVLDNEGTNISLKVYPNPATEFCYVSLNLEDSEFVNIELYNALGQLIYVERINDSDGPITHKVPLPSDAGEGIYVIKIEVDKKAYYRKVVVN